jgi:hypothetical protein
MFVSTNQFENYISIFIYDFIKICDDNNDNNNRL